MGCTSVLFFQKEMQLGYLQHCALIKQAEIYQTLKCFTPNFSLGGEVAFLHWHLGYITLSLLLWNVGGSGRGAESPPACSWAGEGAAGCTTHRLLNSLAACQAVWQRRKHLCPNCIPEGPIKLGGRREERPQQGHHTFASNEERLACWRPSFITFSCSRPTFSWMGGTQSNVASYGSLKKFALTHHHCSPALCVCVICVLFSPGLWLCTGTSLITVESTHTADIPPPKTQKISSQKSILPEHHGSSWWWSSFGGSAFCGLSSSSLFFF